MPCSSEHMRPTGSEIEHSRVLALLEELRTGTLPEYYGNGSCGATKGDLDSDTSELCSELQEVTDITTCSLEMQMWRRDHQKADARRVKKEQEEQDRRHDIQNALAKLTPYEQELLRNSEASVRGEHRDHTMKEWPKDKAEPADFERLVEPIRQAIEFAYNLDRKNEEQDIPYSGYNIGHDDRATCLSPDNALSAHGLEFSLEDHDRDALDVILIVALQLGIEQGRRIAFDKARDRIQSLAIGDELCDRLLSTLGLEIKMSDKLREGHEAAKAEKRQKDKT